MKGKWVRDIGIRMYLRRRFCTLPEADTSTWADTSSWGDGAGWEIRGVKCKKKNTTLGWN